MSLLLTYCNVPHFRVRIVKDGGLLFRLQLYNPGWRGVIGIQRVWMSKWQFSPFSRINMPFVFHVLLFSDQTLRHVLPTRALAHVQCI